MTGYGILLAGMLLSFIACFQIILFYSHQTWMTGFFERLNSVLMEGSPSDFGGIVIPPQLTGIIILMFIAIVGGFGLKLIEAGHNAVFGKVPKKVMLIRDLPPPIHAGIYHPIPGG